MPVPLNAPLPIGLELAGAYTIQLNAIDATTGNTVSGVVISQARYQTEPTGATTPEQLAPPPVLVPETPSV